MKWLVAMERSTRTRIAAGVVVALGAAALALADPGTALWLSAPMALLWLLASGLMRPVERLIERIRSRFDGTPARAASRSLPSLPLLVCQRGRHFTVSTAVRPPPFVLLPSLPG